MSEQSKPNIFILRKYTKLKNVMTYDDIYGVYQTVLSEFNENPELSDGITEDSDAYNFLKIFFISDENEEDIATDALRAFYITAMAISDGHSNIISDLLLYLDESNLELTLENYYQFLSSYENFTYYNSKFIILEQLKEIGFDSSLNRYYSLYEKESSYSSLSEIDYKTYKVRPKINFIKTNCEYFRNYRDAISFIDSKIKTIQEPSISETFNQYQFKKIVNQIKNKEESMFLYLEYEKTGYLSNLYNDSVLKLILSNYSTDSNGPKLKLQKNDILMSLNRITDYVIYSLTKEYVDNFSEKIDEIFSKYTDSVLEKLKLSIATAEDILDVEAINFIKLYVTNNNNPIEYYSDMISDMKNISMFVKDIYESIKLDKRFE